MVEERVQHEPLDVQRCPYCGRELHPAALEAGPWHKWHPSVGHFERPEDIDIAGIIRESLARWCKVPVWQRLTDPEFAKSRVNRRVQAAKEKLEELSPRSREPSPPPDVVPRSGGRGDLPTQRSPGGRGGTWSVYAVGCSVRFRDHWSISASEYLGRVRECLDRSSG